jgi:hypothetical protein
MQSKTTSNMNRVIVRTGFSRYSDAEIYTAANNILGAMNGNMRFPSPQPALTELKSHIEAYGKALEEAADGGRMYIAAKNGARAVLTATLDALALYVQQNCGNDLAALLSSGFSARKTPQPAGIVEAPKDLVLKPNHLSGRLDVRAKAVPNAAAYEPQTTTDPSNEESWKGRGTFTSTRITLDEFKPGTVYWARLRAVGAAGPGAWSAPTSTMAI